jgi:hypothetical protein
LTAKRSIAGIYKPLDDGNELYGHCAKLMGWGVQNGTPYWLYMNTWGRDWGENGNDSSASFKHFHDYQLVYQVFFEWTFRKHLKR